MVIGEGKVYCKCNALPSLHMILVGSISGKIVGVLFVVNTDLAGYSVNSHSSVMCRM